MGKLAGEETLTESERYTVVAESGVREAIVKSVK